MDAFSQRDRPCEILVVNQQCEPVNEAIMMKLIRKLFELKQSQYSEYNFEFPHRTIYILVDIRNCRKDTVSIPHPEAIYIPTFVSCSSVEEAYLSR